MNPQMEIAILRAAKVVAVVGLSNNVERPAYEVAAYLQEQGFRIVPVHPAVAEVLGEKAYASLSAIPFHVDVVDVFRRSEAVGPIVDEAIAIGAGAVWLQEGVANADAEQRARAAGLAVVSNRCILKAHVERSAELRP